MSHMDHALVALRRAVNPTDLASRSLWRNIQAIITDWAVIAIAITCLFRAPLWVHPVLLLIIASRQHALLVLMHDASHYMLCKDKGRNDLLSDLFCAFPFCLTTRAYRVHHLAHHAQLNTPQDPDLVRKAAKPEEWTFPQPISAVLLLLLKDLLGLSLIDILKNISRLSGHREPVKSEYRYSGVIQAAYLLALIGIVGLTGHFWFFIYAWLVPLFFFLPPILRLRSIAEHFALPHEHKLNESRSIQVSWWEALLLCPHNVGRHLEHHLFPYVPWYRLEELNERLSNNPSYREQANQNRGLLFGDCSVVQDMRRVKDNIVPLLIGADLLE